MIKIVYFYIFGTNMGDQSRLEKCIGCVIDRMVYNFIINRKMICLGKCVVL